jgi:hypothetical protein
LTAGSRRRSRLVAPAALALGGALASLAGGCTVGDGNGAAIGPIWELGCSDDGADYGTEMAPRIFDLSPRFFAGEPIEDIAAANRANRLLMRIQRNGNRLEVNDTLYFDVVNAYEIARCVRGRIDENGLPDYDTRMTTDLFTHLPTTTPWCDWSGIPTFVDGGSRPDAGADAGGGGDAGVGPTGPPHARIHLGVDEIVHSSLSLMLTCHKDNVVGEGFDGWIDFQDFGLAAEPGVAREMRDAIRSDFKVNFGERLRASFEVVLGDQRVVTAVKGLLPIPDSFVGGYLDGSFDFDLERGRAAQPFP